MITAYDVLRAMLFCKVLSEHPHFTVPAGYFSIIHISEQIMPLHSFVAFSLLFISQTTLLRFLYLLFDLYLFVSSEATSRIAKKNAVRKRPRNHRPRVFASRLFILFFHLLPVSLFDVRRPCLFCFNHSLVGTEPCCAWSRSWRNYWCIQHAQPFQTARRR